MLVKNTRFKVVKKRDVIEVSGYLSENENFQALDEMLSDQSTISCWGVEGVSWNGLTNFIDQIKASGQVCYLKSIPLSLYKALKLMPELRPWVVLQEYELALFETTGDYGVRNVMFKDEELKDQHKEHTLFLTSNEGKFIQGPADLDAKLEINQAGVESIWVEENLSEFRFWFNYYYFCDSILFLSQEMLAASSSSLIRSMTDVKLTVQAFEVFSELLGKTQVNKVDDIFVEFEKTSVEKINMLRDKIIRSAEDSESILRRIQIKVINGGIISRSDIFEDIGQYADVILVNQRLLNEVEELGCLTGEFLQKFPNAKYFKKIIDSVADEEISQDLLVKIRDTFEIMNPMTTGSWEDTKKEVLEQLEAMNQKVYQSVVVIQGFDLLRQVIEHRVHEAQMIKDYIFRDDRDWQAMKKELFAHVIKTLVTDQEKFSCNYFIPDASKYNSKQAVSPGSVVLF